MGDTQIITSVAILLSGYVQLPCGLSTYYWGMIVNLAWFSALTHLATLTSLRYYFMERPAMSFWRVLFMGITFILLSSALYPTGYVPQNYNVGYDYILTSQDFEHFLSSPALCLMSGQGRAELTDNLFSASNADHTESKIDPPFNKTLISISLTYLMVSYVTRVIRLSRSAAEKTNSWLRVIPIKFLCRADSAARILSFRCRILCSIFRGFLLICIALAEAVYEIGNSVLWEISWLAAALIWGTFRLLQHRQHPYLVGQNTWGFGQVLTLMLSALPLWSFLSNLQESVLIPLPIDTNPTSMQMINELGRLDQYSWFNALVSLILVKVLTLAGCTIYSFSGSGLLHPGRTMGSDILYQDTRLTTKTYLIAVSCSTSAAMLFMAVALAFQYQVIPISKLSAWWRRLTVNWSTGAQQRVISGAWIALMTILNGAQVFFYISVLGTFNQRVYGHVITGTRHPGGVPRS